MVPDIYLDYRLLLVSARLLKNCRSASGGKAPASASTAHHLEQEELANWSLNVTDVSCVVGMILLQFVSEPSHH